MNEFFFRFAVDLLATFILIRLVYFQNYRRSDLFLTFFGFNTIIFILTYLLNQVEMSMGAAFGLFAVFSMLRYRTEGISAKDMTYLFINIALGLINAIGHSNWQILILMNLILVGLTASLEFGVFARKELAKNVIYDKIELIHHTKRSELIEDLKARTGLNIQRVEIQEFDFLKDSALLTIYFYD